ncbi:UDP-4-amino-4-deoxy-L-arabinose--oxoglutarate aminotransferase [compost metagenome]
MTTWGIPYFELQLGAEEQAAALSVIESNWLTMGPKIAEFETSFAAALEIEGSLERPLQAIAVANCTVALHLALAALEIGPGDEVICPSLTFVATANAIRYVGAQPVFADICSEDEWNLDPRDVEAKITPRTKAILVMHYGGYPCRMKALGELAKKHGLRIVEDTSHGPLAESEGRMLGTIGDVGCFSFFSNKNMTTGEGGMVVTRDPELAQTLRAMRAHGMTASSYERFKGHAFGYDVTLLGFNFRMDEIRAAIGVEQLKKLPVTNERRKDLVTCYHRHVAQQVPSLVVPFRGWSGRFGYHIFPLLLPRNVERGAVMAALAEHGIQTSIHYRPVHTFSAYQDVRAEVPVTNAIAPRILSLPLFPTLTEDKIERVVMSLKSCLES